MLYNTNNGATNANNESNATNNPAPVKGNPAPVFLTPSELLKKAAAQDKQYYYATQRYTILNAFTKFILAVEQRARIEKKDFKIVATSVKNIMRCLPVPAFSYDFGGVDEKSRATVFGYCKFIYDNRFYSFEIDANPFFPHYFAAVPIYDNKIPDYYVDEWQPFESIESAYGQNIENNITVNLQKMLSEFERLKNRNTIYTKKDKRKPAEIKQTYYINLY